MSTLKVNTINASTSGQAVDVDIKNPRSFRNIIINGAAQVNQRGDLTGQTSSVYFVDRFRVAMSSAGTWSLSQSTDTPDGFGNSMKLDCTTAKSSLDADSFMMLQQKIEGQNVQAFAKGTSAAKEFAVSFYIKSNVSGTYTAEVQDNDNNRIASKTFTVSDGNWNRYSLVFPADTTGAFDNDNAQSMDIKIWFAGGSNYTSGTLNTSSWASKTNANRVSSSNINLASSTSNELYITGVQLEVGSVATDFEHKTFAQELELCKRYLQDFQGGDGDYVLALANTWTSTQPRFILYFSPEMRAAPTFSTPVGNYKFRNASGATQNDTGTSASGSDINTKMAVITGSQPQGGLNAGNVGQVRLVTGSNTPGIARFEAEL